MSVSIEDINILGDIIDTTWGKTSSPSTIHHISIKARILNEDTIHFQYSAIVNFTSYINTIPQKMQHREDGLKIINECLKLIKTKFKDRTGKTIKFDSEKIEDGMEMIHTQPYINSKKTAYFRVSSYFSFEIK